MRSRDGLVIATLAAMAASLLGPWAVLQTHMGPQGRVEGVQMYLWFMVRDGIRPLPAVPGIESAVAGALVMVAAGGLATLGALRAWERVSWWTASGWFGLVPFPVIGGGLLAANGQDEVLYRTVESNIGPDFGWGFGAALLVIPLAVATAIVYRPRRRVTAEAMPLHRRQTWVLAAALAATLALFVLPVVQTEVVIDAERTYWLDGWPSESTFSGDFDAHAWGRNMPDHPGDGGFHGWWDAHYLNKGVNLGLYVAGVALILVTIGHLVAFAWRAKPFLFVLVGGHVVVLAAFWVGLLGELTTAEYVDHGVLWPSWAHLASVAAVVLLVVAAVGPRPSTEALPDAVMPALPERPESDRNP